MTIGIPGTGGGGWIMALATLGPNPGAGVLLLISSALWTLESCYDFFQITTVRAPSGSARRADPRRFYLLTCDVRVDRPWLVPTRQAYRHFRNNGGSASAAQREAAGAAANSPAVRSAASSAVRSSALGSDNNV